MPIIEHWSNIYTIYLFWHVAKEWANKFTLFFAAQKPNWKVFKSITVFDNINLINININQVELESKFHEVYRLLIQNHLTTIKCPIKSYNGGESSAKIMDVGYL